MASEYIENGNDTQNEDDVEIERMAVEKLRVLPKIKGCDQPLSLEITYVDSWELPDAFREVYQNWSDGMRESNNLMKKNFIIKFSETEDPWVAKALHPDTKEFMGYIRHLPRKGMIEFTNFNSKLDRRTLNFGGGDKKFKTHLAGGHGDGYKAAAAVALREGYQYRYEASNCTWRFHVGRVDAEQVYCEIKPKLPIPLERVRRDFNQKYSGGASREVLNYIHKDVSLKMGNVYHSESFPGRKITKRDFQECMKVSLDLVRPLKMIWTPYGELIIDNDFKDRVYFKRLFLDGSHGPSKYKYGYHFNHCKTDRDRRRLSDRSDARYVANIWEYVINQEPAYLANYIEMFEDESYEWSDIYLAKNWVSLGIAEKISEYYFKEDTERRIFYHDSRNGNRELEIIKGSLKKTPQSLLSTIWDILRKHELVRTPQEQQERLLERAPEAADKGTTYSNNIVRGVKAILVSDARTKSLQLSFRSREKSELDLLLSGSILNINEKWLDLRASHEEMPCCLSRTTNSEIYNEDSFYCYHVLIRLYELLLDELARNSNQPHSEVAEIAKTLEQRVKETLSQVPFMVRAISTQQSGEIIVSWTDLDHWSKVPGLKTSFRITLHRKRTCSSRREDLLSPDQCHEAQLPEYDSVTLNTPTLAACGCPEQIVWQKDGNAVFQNLELGTAYFPMVSRTCSKALYGLPPGSIFPSAQSEQLSTRMREIVTSPSQGDLDELLPDLIGHEDVISSGPDDDIYIDSSSDSDPTSERGEMELNPSMGRQLGRNPEIVSGSCYSPHDTPFRTVARGPMNLPMASETQDFLSLQTENSNLHEQLSEKFLEVERARSEIKGLEENLTLKDEKIRAASSMILKLQQQLVVANGSKEEMKREGIQLQDSLSTELQTTRGELRATSAQLETLQQREIAINKDIENLRSRIRQLEDEKQDLEADLELAQDINRKQAQLTANRNARMRARETADVRVKREIIDVDEHDDHQRHPSKRARADSHAMHQAENDALN